VSENTFAVFRTNLLSQEMMRLLAMVDPARVKAMFENRVMVTFFFPADPYSREQQGRRLVEWLHNNTTGFYCIEGEFRIGFVEISFEHERDMVAFKLRFEGAVS